MGVLDDLLSGIQTGSASQGIQQTQPDTSQLNGLMSNPAPPSLAPQKQGSSPMTLGPQAQGIKVYLSNIFYNMGEAAKAHLGMPTDVQVEQNQQRLNQTQQQIDQQGQLTQSQLQLHAA